jgi:nitronate monooxygenase
MSGWRDRRLLDPTGARVPIVQAPMAGAGGVALAIAAIEGGAVGSLPCATITPDEIVRQAEAVRAAAGTGPLNLNFFCHQMGPLPDGSAWRALLAPFYAEEGASPPDAPPRLRLPFDDAQCAAVEAVRPAIVSFHFGLPEPALLERVRQTGALIVGNATTVAEARWLAEHGCDAIIAQGYEAGGHAGYFLSEHEPVGLMALVRGIVHAVDLPVIAAGGIAEPEAIAAALTLGAAAVNIGTAYLPCPESLVPPAHKQRLGTPAAAHPQFTKLFYGRRARGLPNRLVEALGPIRDEAPAFPYAAVALAPLRQAAEAEGRLDFTQMWAGQAAALTRNEPARALTERLAAGALAIIEGRS